MAVKLSNLYSIHNAADTAGKPFNIHNSDTRNYIVIDKSLGDLVEDNVWIDWSDSSNGGIIFYIYNDSNHDIYITRVDSAGYSPDAGDFSFADQELYEGETVPADDYVEIGGFDGQCMDAAEWAWTEVSFTVPDDPAAGQFAVVGDW